MIVVTIIFGLLGLGIMIFIHELGHFLAAKASGVVVEIFSLGWGRRLLGMSIGKTSYQISWFPFGGYCKMLGSDAIFQSNEEHTTEPGSYYSVSAWRRICIVMAGPLANLCFAFILLSLIAFIGFRFESPPSRIVLSSDYSLEEVPESTPAIKAGLMTGDLIIKVNDINIANFSELRNQIEMSTNSILNLIVERDGALLGTKIIFNSKDKTIPRRIGVYPWIDPIVVVKPNSTAALAGLRNGDYILSINNNDVDHAIDVLNYIHKSTGHFVINLERDGSNLELEITQDPSISFFIPQHRSPRLSIYQSLGNGARQTIATINQSITGFSSLFNRNPGEVIAGPLRITYFVGSAAATGFKKGIGSGILQFFNILSVISIVLFVMNLLPLPALDGGHIVLYIIELLRGKPVPANVTYRIQTIGMSILLALALAVTFGDVIFFVGE